MTKEAQNIDWKETWYNAFLKRKCGFAKILSQKVCKVQKLIFLEYQTKKQLS